MAYEIETSGTQSTTGVRAADAGEPNFPSPASAGSGEMLSFASDLICDPADTDNDCDPASGWKPGVKFGSPGT